MYTIRHNLNGTFHYYIADNRASSETLFATLRAAGADVLRMY